MSNGRPPAEASDSKAPRRSRLIALTAVGFTLVAFAATAPILVDIAHVSSRPKVSLASGPQQVALPPHARYGLFFNDPDNSGYEEICSAKDHGVQVVLSEPGFSVSSSNTEDLDYVFNTGSGSLLIDCRSTAEQVLAKPIPNYEEDLLRIALALLFGIGAVVCAILWFAGIGARRDPSGGKEA